jgi:hypothetical protein
LIWDGWLKLRFNQLNLIVLLRIFDVHNFLKKYVDLPKSIDKLLSAQKSIKL